MENSIQTVEQQTVLFYDDELVAVRSEANDIYVSLRHLCDALGINRQSQVKRLKRSKVLVNGYQRGVIMTPHRGKQSMGLLRADLVPLWLSGVETSRVKEDVREKLELYQVEVGKVLWEAFQSGRLSMDNRFGELLQNDNSPSVQAYKMAQAIMQMAQQQIMLEGRMDDHEQRIGQLESIIGDETHQITPAQASQISQGVKAIAMSLSKASGRNEYGGVYGELYRRFEITSYKQLPKDKFDAAAKFLTDWYLQASGDDSVPF